MQGWIYMHQAPRLSVQFLQVSCGEELSRPPPSSSHLSKPTRQTSVSSHF